MKPVMSLFLSAALAAVGLSCSQGGPWTACPQDAAVTFTAGAAGITRAGQEVSSLDVFAFRSGGGLDARARAEGDAVTARVTAGMPLDCRLVANMPEGLASGVLRGSDLDDVLCPLTAETGPLTMVSAWTSLTFSGRSDVSCPVTRLVARLTVDTLVSVLESSDVVLRGVYLTNVAGTCPLDTAFVTRAVPPVPEVWYNRMRFDLPGDSPLRPLLCDMRARTLERGVDELLGVSFLYYPNPVSNGIDATTHPQWCPRPTRLVLEMDVDGRTRWYPVTLPAGACNRRLHISRLTVSGPGSPDPDIPVDRVGISFNMEILPWDVTDMDVNF